MPPWTSLFCFLMSLLFRMDPCLSEPETLKVQDHFKMVDLVL